MYKTGEMFMAILEKKLQLQIATRALIKLRERYSKLDLSFMKIGTIDNFFYVYNKIVLVGNEDINIDRIQEDYEYFYQIESYNELDKIVKKLIE